MEVKDSKSRVIWDLEVWLLIRIECRFLQVRFFSYLSGWSHGYLKTHILVPGIKSEIWWATFQEIKATNKIALVPFSMLWEMANGQELL